LEEDEGGDSMTIPSYPTDRASIVSRGLVNLRKQQKTIQHELEWTKRELDAMLERKRTLEAARRAEYEVRVINLTDVLRVLALYIELGEAEQKRMKHQPSLFEEVPA